LKDKGGIKLLPILEDMRLRKNAVLICSFGGDDPSAPLAAHLAESHSAQIATGLQLLAEAGGCTDIILYAAELDLTALAALLDRTLNVTVKTGPSSPVLREATALYAVIDTGVIRAGNAEEDYNRTFLSYGYQGRPTLAVDAETVFQAYRLSEWLGMTKHIAVIGTETDLREADTGVSLEALLGDTAGLKKVLVGGLWGVYLNAADLGAATLAYEYVYDCIKPLGEGDCIVRETAELYRRARELTCQKCVLCREGSWQLQTIFTDITEGKATRDDIALIEDICPLISAGSLCAFGKHMVSPALSIISACRDEMNEHIVGKNCASGRCSGLLNYLIDPSRCTGCGECMESCPEEAIEGEDGFIHMIDDKLCAKCGKCVPVCPEGAIKCGGEKIKVPKKLTKVGKFH
jgi:NADH-quinone oxidoreductase subunit F